MRIGIRPREHVALWAGNWPEWVVLKLALAKLNAVAVPLPVPLSPDSLEVCRRVNCTPSVLCVATASSMDREESPD